MNPQTNHPGDTLRRAAATSSIAGPAGVADRVERFVGVRLLTAPDETELGDAIEVVAEDPDFWRLVDHHDPHRRYPGLRGRFRALVQFSNRFE